MKKHRWQPFFRAVQNYVTFFLLDRLLETKFK